MKNRFRVRPMLAAVGLMTQLSAPLPASGQTPPPGPAPAGAPGTGRRLPPTPCWRLVRPWSLPRWRPIAG